MGIGRLIGRGAPSSGALVDRIRVMIAPGMSPRAKAGCAVFLLHWTGDEWRTSTDVGGSPREGRNPATEGFLFRSTIRLQRDVAAGAMV